MFSTMFQQGEKTLPELSNSVTILSNALPLAYFAGSENHNSVAFRAFHIVFDTRSKTSWLFCCFSRTLRVDLLVHKQCSHEILLHFRPQSHSLSNRYCNRDRHYRELHYILRYSFSAPGTFALTPQNQIFCWLTIGQRLSFIHFRHW